MPNAEIVELTLQIEQRGSDGEELDRLTRQLSGEIGEFDVELVSLATGGPPPRYAKSTDLALLGGLIVAVAPTLLTKILEFLHDWAMLREGRKIKIKIQAKDGTLVEVDFPSTMSSTEVKNWIGTVSEALPRERSLSTKG